MQLEKYKNNKKINSLIIESQKSQTPITDEVLLKNQDILDDFLLFYKECDINKECVQNPKGNQVNIVFENGRFYIQNTACVHKLQQQELDKIINNYLYTDFDVKDFSIVAKDYYFSELTNQEFNLLTNNEKKEKAKILKYALENQKKGNYKGIYLYGAPGVGKTYIFKILANTFASKDYKVVFCTLRSVIDKVRRSFNATSKKGIEIVENLKNVDVLFLDDIGGENLSSWSRDDFLFEVLNYRMENKKMTFFTSNFSIKQLKENLRIKTTNKKYADNIDPSVEDIKIERIVSRIKTLAFEKEIKWKVKRNSQ
ncbi:ATP-binding protein [Mycoplasma cottewii]|uniref:ATP-binding protein n=1 Tax=Mycoplasma cottewii TaxID=51364 RepID=A0ABY5TVZ1_9MOLU|nr:ATP-binding protein [Mycoplasma cottewii]UWD34833.1 ATP-binding protein [Mycoplasma cottewii]